MTVLTTARSVPRAVVTGWLAAGRLPLTSAQRVVGQQGNDQWPPVLAYESFEAAVETLIGSLLKDDQLVQRGRLRQAKSEELRTAAQLHTVSEQQQEHAEQELSERRDEIAEQRENVQDQATQRKASAERAAKAREATAQSKAVKKTAAAKRTKAAEDASIDRRERQTKLSALDAESRAVSAAAQAVAAEESVDALDDAIETSKAARKSS